MRLRTLNLLRVLSIALLVVFSACSTHKAERNSLISEYENTQENQEHIHRNQFKNRMEENNTRETPNKRMWSW